MEKYYHSTEAPVDKIDNNIGFGGLFCEWHPHKSHGSYVLELSVSGEILTQCDIDYRCDYDEITEIIKRETMCDDDDLEKIVECVTSDRNCDLLADGVNFDYDCNGGWEVQRLRGVLARELGYAGVECEDEHGTVVLIVKAESIRQI